jgi:hypothetical protein
VCVHRHVDHEHVASAEDMLGKTSIDGGPVSAAPLRRCGYRRRNEQVITARVPISDTILVAGEQGFCASFDPTASDAFYRGMCGPSVVCNRSHRYVMRYRARYIVAEERAGLCCTAEGQAAIPSNVIGHRTSAMRRIITGRAAMRSAGE